MKKMNNKGFAASTLLYGLMLVGFLVVSLLMSIMATNRKNTSMLVKKIEEELNRYSETATVITSTDGAQEYIVPYGKSGWYKIELWGAAGKEINTIVETSAYRGAYVSGLVYLQENTSLYFHIGEVGSVYNWTDVRTEDGIKTSSVSSRSRIMVAAGGERTSPAGGTGYGPNYSISHYNDGGSYLAGYAGMNSILQNGSYSGETHSYTGYNIINGTLLSGVNAGAGKAKIELVEQSDTKTTPPKKYASLNGIRYIRECLTLSSNIPADNDGKEIWKEIQAINSDGKNVAKNKSARFSLAGNESGSIANLTDGSLFPIVGGGSVSSGAAIVNRCITIDLVEYHNLEEIAVFHHIGSNMKIIDEKLEVSSNGSSYLTLKNWDNESHAPIEANYGIRFSDRQTENRDIISVGKYYIASKLSNERFVTAVEESAGYELFTGELEQKWYIEGIAYTDNYKITEINSNKILKNDTSDVKVSGTYSGKEEEEWQAVNLGNGYYQFINVKDTTKCLSVNTTAVNTSGYLVLNTCDNTSSAQQFKLINAD